MRAKLRATKSTTPPRVDREGGEHGAGVIRGLSLATKGDALGHGFELDDESIDQIAQLANGAKGRWTHGNLCADGLGTHLGRWRDVRREGDKALGDFHFSKLASKVKPEGLDSDAPSYLMDLAENEPDVAGVSVVIDYELAELKRDADDESDDAEKYMAARVTKVPRADYVADPAANPAGLFSSTPSELAEVATAALNEAEEAYGRDRVRAFLSAHLTETTSRTTGTEARNVKTVEELKAELAEQKAKVDALAEINEALKAQLAAAEQAEQARKDGEFEAYVDGLKTAACDAGSAIDEAKLEKVRKAYTDGHADLARALGDAFLGEAKARGGGSVRSESTTTALGASSEFDKKTDESLARFRERQARRQTLGA